MHGKKNNEILNATETGEKHGRGKSTVAVNQQIGANENPEFTGLASTQRNPGTASMQTRNSGTFTGDGIRRTLVACGCQLHGSRRPLNFPTAAITPTTELQFQNTRKLTSTNFQSKVCKNFSTRINIV